MNSNSGVANPSLDIALPWPDDSANKYSRGKLILAVGSERYPGAACLATRAAQRMGAGYVEVVTSSDTVRQLVLGYCPSAVVTSASSFAPELLEAVKPGHPQAVCIGPGFDSGDEQAKELLVQVAKHAVCPLLIDGGALSFLASKHVQKALRKRKKHNRLTVVTPHGGEAARLAKAYGVSAETPEDMARALSQAMGAIVVLKGPDTYIASGEDVHPMREGTVALAKAGTGDILAGMIASLLAQGVEGVSAAVLGSTLHARAGIVAAERFSVIGVTPEDIVEAIPAAIKE